MLKKLKNLFNSFEENNIKYVIWKSLENIDKALAGLDDIDIIFDKEQYDRICQSLHKHNFVKDTKSIGNVGGDLKVFRGFDVDSGRFIMVHVHFKCRFGSKECKEFRFPREEEMLKNFKIYQGVKILNDSFFIITRLLAAATKRDKEDKYLPILANSFFNFNKEEQTTVINYLFPYFGDEIHSILDNLKKGNISVLGNYYPQVSRKLEKIHDSKERKCFHFILEKIVKRNKINCSLDIVLAGGDGTGKSSVAARLQSDLVKIASVKVVYLGRNRWFFFNKELNKIRMSRPFLFLNYIWPVTSTLEIIFRYFRGKIFKLRGGIVIYDRSLKDLLLKYQEEKFSISWFPRLIFLALKNQEADLPYLLVARPEAVTKRKPKHSLEEIRRKQKVYQDYFKEPFKIIDTTDITVKEVSVGIIDDIFGLASRRLSK